MLVIVNLFGIQRRAFWNGHKYPMFFICVPLCKKMDGVCNHNLEQCPRPFEVKQSFGITIFLAKISYADMFYGAGAIHTTVRTFSVPYYIDHIPFYPAYVAK